MNGPEEEMTLASELGAWQVLLQSGDKLELAAHGYSVKESAHVFVLLIDGQPCYEVEVLRIPNNLIQTVLGG